METPITQPKRDDARSQVEDAAMEMAEATGRAVTGWPKPADRAEAQHWLDQSGRPDPWDELPDKIIYFVAGAVRVLIAAGEDADETRAWAHRLHFACMNMAAEAENQAWRAWLESIVNAN